MDELTVHQAEARCPTCRATQDWSDTCRRCKSDLRLLRAFTEEHVRVKRAGLHAINEGDARSATRHARAYHALQPGPDSRRLLALAAFLRGDWEEAIALVRMV